MGGAFEPFALSRGIRKGDPLSPYILILCMELLGHLIKKCTKGTWTPLKASHGNVGISHLFLVNDLILLVKVNMKVCEAIPDVLQVLCSKLGQKVSAKKSRIYFSPNVDSNLKERIWDRLGMQATINFGNHLEFPLKHEEAPMRQFNFVVERVMSELSGWKWWESTRSRNQQYPLHIPVRPITRARSKKIREWLNGLIQEFWTNSNTGHFKLGPKEDEGVINLIQAIDKADLA